jgi:hypothetical protein
VNIAESPSVAQSKADENKMFLFSSWFGIAFFFLLLFSCKSRTELAVSDASKLFTFLPPEFTGVSFANNLVYTERLNPYTFHTFYNGGGVAVGDINNDGLQDLFFCSNQGSNKLYLNKGNFKFEDISERAGIFSEGLWSTGVSFTDINGDGLLDIYVCRAADFLAGLRGNQLYINRGDLTFEEKAEEYKLASTGFSTHAAFFDYDNDGDLDCYLLSNSNRSGPDYYEIKEQRKRIDVTGGNRIYRNDGNAFTDVTSQTGIYGSIIGFGLGVAISDINKDGWQDVYVSNDFFEKDYLYINKGNGRFEESLEKWISEISMFSMGADIADINNDGYPEIYVTDMLPEEETRIKSKTRFETWEKYQSNVKNGYYHQFLRNVLQLNRGPLYRGKGDPAEFHFSEISRLAGVQASDWSWGALIADLNNDGFKDVFVSNGIYKDVTDQDFIQFIANSFEASKLAKKQRTSKKELIDLIPSQRLSNYAYCNNGDLTFTNKAKEWGLDKHSFSNGSAYADLDNDGDLDLVTNNINAPAAIYRNNSTDLLPDNKFITIEFRGEGKNPFGVGTKVTVYHDHTLAYQEVAPARGFQSSVDNRLHFGLGKVRKIDSVLVDWPDGKESVLKGINPNQTIIAKQSEALFRSDNRALPKRMTFTAPGDNYGIDFEHKEEDYVDFNFDKLIFYMHSTQGPRMTMGDVNADGREDLYIGGAKGQPGGLFLQTPSGRFKRNNLPAFEKDKLSEDTDCQFFDANGDGRLDLYVCSGSSEFAANSPALMDRIYINESNGNLVRAPKPFLSAKGPGGSSCVSATDFDQDGDLDLFVGMRLRPGLYGLPCRGTLWQNDGKGLFTDVTDRMAPELVNAGMITDGEWIDYDQDGKPDLVITGEYMPIKVFHNDGPRLREVTGAVGLNKTNGWWNRLIVCDIDGDGYPDLVAGNHGLNSRFKASEEKPVTMFVSDFDDNGTLEQIVCTYNGDKQYPMVLRHDLVGLLPYLKKKYLRYEDYKGKTIGDIFTSDQLTKAMKWEAFQMQSCVLLNNRRGGFTLKVLPVEAQFSPIYGIVVRDFDGDRKEDILLGGNFYQAKPEVGINDASYGLLLKGDGHGEFNPIPMAQSNLFVKGAVRDMILLKSLKRDLVVISKNNGTVEMLERNSMVSEQ